jgi:hypothetical protein
MEASLVSSYDLSKFLGLLCTLWVALYAPVVVGSVCGKKMFSLVLCAYDFLKSVVLFGRFSGVPFLGRRNGVRHGDVVDLQNP